VVRGRRRCSRDPLHSAFDFVYILFDRLVSDGYMDGPPHCYLYIIIKDRMFAVRVLSIDCFGQKVILNGKCR
jgi:hypothetical protein